MKSEFTEFVGDDQHNIISNITNIKSTMIDHFNMVGSIITNNFSEIKSQIKKKNSIISRDKEYNDNEHSSKLSYQLSGVDQEPAGGETEKEKLAINFKKFVKKDW